MIWVLMGVFTVCLIGLFYEIKQLKKEVERGRLEIELDELDLNTPEFRNMLDDRIRRVVEIEDRNRRIK